MKKLITLLCLMTVTLPAIAQENSKFSFELGKISNYELTMTQYEADTTADAIVIYESGDFYFKHIDREKDYYYSLVKTYKTKIKILKPSGIERAKFAIPVFQESEYMWENFYVQTANVYNYNPITKQIEQSTYQDEEWLIGGKKTKENKLNKNFTIKNFTFPDVKVGSIIEIEYVIETPFVFSFEWLFQKNIPVVYSKLRYRANAPLVYVQHLNSNKKFDEYNEELLRTYSSTIKQMAFTFGMKDIAAFKIGNKNDMLTLYFQLKQKISIENENVMGSEEIVGNWKEYSNEILAYDDFGKYIKQTEKEAKNILPTLNLYGKNQLETMEGILNYVKSNYNWNGFYGKYVLHQLPDFLKHKNGNAANINLFLIGLLNAAKVPATPVLISKYNNNIDNEVYPLDAFYNYVIARVTIGNTTYYLDAANFKQTSELTGFVVKKNSNEFIKITKIEPNTINNLKPEQEKFDNDGEFNTILNTFKKIFCFIK